MPHVYIYIYILCKIAILLLHNFEVPFTNGAGVQCVYLYAKVGIDRMDKVAKQLDKGHHVMKLRFTRPQNSSGTQKVKVHKWWVFQCNFLNNG